MTERNPLSRNHFLTQFIVNIVFFRSITPLMCTFHTFHTEECRHSGAIVCLSDVLYLPTFEYVLSSCLNLYLIPTPSSPRRYLSLWISIALSNLPGSEKVRDVAVAFYVSPNLSIEQLSYLVSLTYTTQAAWTTWATRG